MVNKAPCYQHNNVHKGKAHDRCLKTECAYKGCQVTEEKTVNQLQHNNFNLQLLRNEQNEMRSIATEAGVIRVAPL